METYHSECNVALNAYYIVNHAVYNIPVVFSLNIGPNAFNQNINFDPLPTLPHHPPVHVATRCAIDLHTSI